MAEATTEYGKKRKQQNPKLYSFQSFCNSGDLFPLSEPFRDTIRVFLRECAELKDYHLKSMPVWCTLLSHNDRSDLTVPLYVVEETVKYSNTPFCDHCRCSGWSHHFVSKRRYHFIIPDNDEWSKPLNENAFDAHSHLLHGLIHCNGYGHLLFINGIEGGSKYLRGRELMDLWDHLCTHLRTRKITVEDVSKKRRMELRLLHGVAYGHSWFGRWDYKFGHGSFGVAGHHYSRALEVLGSITLDDIIRDFSGKLSGQTIKQIVSYYRDMSETNLITLRDLLRFMLTLKFRAPPRIKLSLAKPAAPSPCTTRQPSYFTRLTSRFKPSAKKERSNKSRKLSSLVATMDSRWPARRLEYAANIIVDALKEKRESDMSCTGMTRQEVRDAARLHIGDTGLLDYVLKSMNNVIVGKYVVRRAINQMNRVLEYTIEDHHIDGSCCPNEPTTTTERKVVVTEPAHNHKPTSATTPTTVPGSDVYGDIFWIYSHVLLGYAEPDPAGIATRLILDSKRFVKEWPMRDDNDHTLRFICRILPSPIEQDMVLNRKIGPGELVALPLYATFGELKAAATLALRDTYCVAEKYQVSEIGRGEWLDNEVVFGAIESGSEIWVRGNGLNLNTDLIYEGGTEKWIVKCDCGAGDDDGERMISCDYCEVWKHTRCVGIKDSEKVPLIFWCKKCCHSLAPPRADASLGVDGSNDIMLPLLIEMPEMSSLNC